MSRLYKYPVLMDIINAVLTEEVRSTLRGWKTQKKDISKVVDQPNRRFLNSFDKTLTKSAHSLLTDLSELTLTIAAVGTTSGGKSTLINFLCGADVLPSSVQEISSGLVFVEYSEKVAIRVHTTSGALWECNYWQDVTVEEIRTRLRDIMTAYLQANSRGRSGVGSPHVTVYYPIRIQKEILNLPDSIRIKLIDFPGLSSVSDSENLDLLYSVDDSDILYLINFNCAETDHQKTNHLTQTVISKLIKSYRQVLLVFNRIDVFRVDRDWKISEHQFLEKTINDVVEQINEQPSSLFPTSMSKDSRTLAHHILKISSLPAFLSLSMRSDIKCFSSQSANTLNDRFSFFLSDCATRDLPRRTEKWTQMQRDLVAQKVWKASYADNFENQLKSFVYAHLPNLTTAQKMKKFKKKIEQEAEGWRSQSAHFSTCQKRIAEENIQVVLSDTQHFAVRIEAVLDSTLNNIMGRSDFMKKILIYQWYFLRIFRLTKWSLLVRRIKS